MSVWIGEAILDTFFVVGAPYRATQISIDEGVSYEEWKNQWFIYSAGDTPRLTTAASLVALLPVEYDHTVSYDDFLGTFLGLREFDTTHGAQPVDTVT